MGKEVMERKELSNLGVSGVIKVIGGIGLGILGSFVGGIPIVGGLVGLGSAVLFVWGGVSIYRFVKHLKERS